MLRILKFLITGYWTPVVRALPAPKVERCTGYLHDIYQTHVGDCEGLVSPLCWSGRCRAHCHRHCSCERAGITKEEAELIKKFRKDRKDLVDAVREVT